MSVMTSAAVPLPMAKKSWSRARKLLVGLLGTFLILAFLTLSLSPSVETADRGRVPVTLHQHRKPEIWRDGGEDRPGAEGAGIGG